MATGGEIRAAGRLAGDLLAGGVGTVRDVHRAIADRTFRAVGPAAAPARLLHDGITAAVYATVGAAHALVPRLGALVAAQVVPPDAVPLRQRPAGTLALACASGLCGDRMSRSYPELAPDMAVRCAGRDVPLTRAGLTAAYPEASGRLALFAHGLCETEDWWRIGARRHYGDATTSYGSQLHRDLGYTPVYLRYNTGLRVSDSGRQLATLLDSLAGAWPVPVTELVLIGHSMGGLVLRSACHYGQVAGLSWVPVVTHVFCLGTPHHGAPLEKGVNAAAWLLSRAPETQPVARVLNLRSVGMKDLRYGALVDEDWQDVDADELLRDRRTPVPSLAHATYHSVAVTVTRRPGHPVGALVGDLLVRMSSASDHRRRPADPTGTGHHLGRLHHLDLLNHPAVYQQLRLWLTPPPGRAETPRDKRTAEACMTCESPLNNV